MNLDGEKKKILMIEDDSFLRRLYRDRFEKEGFLFVEATNGEEGLNKIRQEKPDLILLNILIPIKGGFDLLREIEEEPELKKIPVIVLTNLGHDEDIREGESYGVAHYLIKAEVRFTEVIRKAKEVLEEKQDGHNY